MPDAACARPQLRPMIARPTQEIERHSGQTQYRAEDQLSAPLAEVVERKIECVTIGVIAPDRRRCELTGTANVMLEDRALVDKALVSRLHDPVTVFAFTAVEHIVCIGQADPA